MEEGEQPREVRIILKFPEVRGRGEDYARVREALKDYLIFLLAIATTKRRLPGPVIERFDETILSVRARIPKKSAEKVVEMIRSLTSPLRGS